MNYDRLAECPQFTVVNETRGMLDRSPVHVREVFTVHLLRANVQGAYHLRGALAGAGADLLYYAQLDIKSDARKRVHQPSPNQKG